MKSGISTFQILIIAIVGYFFVWPYVEDNYIYKDSPKYLVEFKEAIKEFSEQKDTVKDSYKEALDAQSKAKEVKYVFKNENTKNFIIKWKNAENEVTVLRERFGNYKDETENFIDNLDTNLEKIKNDEKLKTRMKEYSKDKAIKMANNIKKIEKNLQYLENSILKGNNLIIALETVSSFNELVEDVKEFDSILNTSNDVFKEIDKLVNEGIKVLDKEMK
jgi:methyl-accepting chemotaxis protein